MALQRLSSPARTRNTLLLPLILLLAAATATSWFTFSHSPPSLTTTPTPLLSFHPLSTKPLVKLNNSHHQLNSTPTTPTPPQSRFLINKSKSSPYHNWDLFLLDFQEMLKTLKIFVYPDAFLQSSPFANVFLPHKNPFDPKIGNYFSEHMFKINLLNSPFLTSDPEKAHFFFLPFSINALRNDNRVHSEQSIMDFVANYSNFIGGKFRFWNASRGTDHFYVCCHSVGRDAASKHRELRNNGVQVACSSSYFQRSYVAHRDVGLPQVWPRAPEKKLNPPKARKRLVFFAGRAQNSQVRQEVISTWENDTSMDIFARNLPFPYEEGFKRSRFCLHVKGYEVNTARISDALHYGCIPVIVSNYYDLPFANVLDWSKFSVLVNHVDIPSLKKILLSVSDKMYESMYRNLCQVRRHFRWHMTPKGYDSFHMTAYQLWLRRGIHVSSHFS